LSLVGQKHVGSATARALLATGLTFAKRDQEAMREFGVAMPIIVAHEYGDGDDDDNVFSHAAQQRLRAVTEVYISLLARSGEKEQAAVNGFQLSEMLRNKSLQRALSAAGVRAAVKDPALAELARKEQDLEKQVGAHIDTLNSLLSLRSEDRDENEVRETQRELDKLQKEHEVTRREINRRFPNYGNLIAPKPVTADDIRKVLRPDEAFVGFHLGRRNSFVWAVTKDRPVGFSVIRMSAGEIEEKVDALRRALAPDVATVSDIPQFDVELAHELFKTLLGPVEATWRSSKSLIVATSGDLGTLPLGLLVTEPPGKAEEAGQPLFASYRNIAWLARTHSIAVVPSGASLWTLRNQAASSPKRGRFIGFGDPLFNRDQPPNQAPADPAGSATTRSIPLDLRASPRTRSVDSASIASLPRLPDTAEELKTIASILEVDPAKVLHLGREANEHVVKNIDLSKYRTVAFATHGLMAGELDGLSQPALALSAPEIAGVEGDGLLTMEEILGLKLDADWVVLSACNTSSGANEGAETATGLGRAFFYAGTRALLVTNWSVHTESARDLVAELFRRQRADPQITRAEALRQAMVEMLDTGGMKDRAGKTAYTYAHPIFWAPYTVIGDGAREQ
jgi:CHAT domain-containing protein